MKFETPKCLIDWKRVDTETTISFSKEIGIFKVYIEYSVKMFQSWASCAFVGNSYSIFDIPHVPKIKTANEIHQKTFQKLKVIIDKTEDACILEWDNKWVFNSDKEVEREDEDTTSNS